ncbi:MAG TPA: YdcF family protein [Gemmatimonadales bacterium]|nr:YdcF family protein [Gemmatimonadales bacterium]
MAAAERPARSRIIGLGSGLCLGVATWILAKELGVASLLGRGTMGSTGWAAAAGALLGLAGLTAILWGLLGVSVATLLLVAWTPVVEGPVHRMIRRDAPGPQPLDAILVLSGNVTGDGFLGSAALDRLVAGISQAKERGVRHLIISRVYVTMGRDTISSEADEMRLARRFASDLDVHSLGTVRTTREEALAVASMARREGWKRLGVVTSPMHSRRACAAVEEAGLAVICLPAAERAYAVQRISTPGNRVRAFQDWLYEAVAMRVYRWRGWVGPEVQEGEH